MPYLIYNDLERPNGFIANLNLNPNKQFRKHLENWFFLKLTLMKGTRIERHQASKELEICDRKLSFWYKKPDFDMQWAMDDIAALKVRWGINESPEIKLE